MGEKEYIEFLLTKVKKNLGAYTETPDLKSVQKIINSLIKAEDFRQILFLLAGVAKLRQLSNYLVFIFKKTEAGKINFDNFSDNLERDAGFIENQFCTFFNLDLPREETQEEESFKQIAEEISTRSEGGEEREAVLQGIDFDIAEMENDIIEEQFAEQLSFEDQEIYNKYDLLQTKKEIEKEEISPFSLPTETKELEEKETGNLSEEKNKSYEPTTQEIPEVSEYIEKEEPTKEDKLEQKTDEEKLFLAYEKQIRKRNEYLLSDIEELHIGNINKKETTAAKKDNIRREYLVEKILENASFLEIESVKMSFEIIASIYSSIRKIYEHYKESGDTTLLDENGRLLQKAIETVEMILNGNETAEIADTIEKINILAKKTEEAFDIQNPEKEDFEEIITVNEQIEKPESWEEGREKIKANIIKIKNIFKKLSDIEGDYQVYEAWRRLSSALNNLKEIAIISNDLGMIKMAQLSEAVYVFIKFVQSYRISPFEETVQNTLRYIMISFKGLFIDKPVKDLDLLISHLNNPIKIMIKEK